MRTIFVIALSFLIAACDRPQQASRQPAAPAPSGPVAGKGVDRSHKGQLAPDTVFTDPDGDTITLEEFRGTPVLVNLWASWCAPCVKELPTLDALSKSHDVDGALGVIAVSEDSGPQASVTAFLAKLGIKTLGAYHDSEMGLTSALGVQIMPTTILYDKQGAEVWRFSGDLDWTGSEAKALLAEAGQPSPAAAR